VLHHESNSLEFGDVGDWIASDSNKVSKLPRFNRADAILPTQHFRGVTRYRANHIERPYPGVVQRREHRRARLAASLSRNEPTHVGSGGKFHSGFQHALNQVVVSL